MKYKGGKMKKGYSIFICIMILSAFLMPMNTFANMAQPNESDISSAITFKENEEIAVTKQVLDITVEGEYAQIVSSYTMQNITENQVMTQSMFLSPNIQNANTTVLIDDEKIEFETESYALDYDTEVKTNDWQYVVLTDSDFIGDERVDTINFSIDFKANEEKTVVVSYMYKLGGYPLVDFDIKEGRIEYLLAPAALWQSYKDLEINVYLSDNMPVIKESNLDFEKIKTGVYQYKSDTLPSENIEIIIDENFFQNIISTIKNPYLLFLLLPLIPIIGAIVLIILIIKLKKKKLKK